MTARPKIALPVATEEGPLPDFLYHGTSTRYLKQILRKGLAPCHMTGAVLMCGSVRGRGVNSRTALAGIGVAIGPCG